MDAPPDDGICLSQKLGQVSLHPSLSHRSSLAADDDGFCSQDFFCTPDFLTPAENQLEVDFEGHKENVISISSPLKGSNARSKRPRAVTDFSILPHPTMSLKDAQSISEELLSDETPSGLRSHTEGNIHADYIRPNSKAVIASMRRRVLSPPCVKNPFRLQENDNDNAIPKSRIPARQVQFLPAVGASSSSRYREEFHEVKEIGRGNFSTVFKVLKRIDGCLYAVKRLHRLLQHDRERREVLTEVQALAAVGLHENVVRYHTAWFESDHLYIQMELCDGCLSDHKLRSTGFKESFLIELLRQVACALAFLHSYGLAHLDIKPDNIYYVGSTFKLGDFGRATKLDGSITIEEGDARYMPLELINDDYRYLPKADIFALGASAYELARNFPLPSSGSQFQALRHGRLPLLPGFSLPFQNLLKILMHHNPEMRPTAEDLIKHPLLSTLKSGNSS